MLHLFAFLTLFFALFGVYTHQKKCRLDGARQYRSLFLVTNRVRQGGILSPIIYMDDQEDGIPSGRRYPSIKAQSTRLLNSFFPQAELKSPCPSLKPHTTSYPAPPPPPPPTTLPHHRKKTVELFLCNSKCATQVSGPVQATCSNPLSSIHTRNFSHTTVCT